MSISIVGATSAVSFPTRMKPAHCYLKSKESNIDCQRKLIEIKAINTGMNLIGTATFLSVQVLLPQSLQAIMRDAPGKELNEITETAYGTAWTPGMLREMTTVSLTDVLLEIVTCFPLAKKPTIREGTMILLLQADNVRKLRKLRGNMYLHL
ncbi:hypothetical protein Rs2_25901 [Raphanus sativus]|nr:hypothetical protein Rs2_25901 [Raphanus sativus]